MEKMLMLKAFFFLSFFAVQASAITIQLAVATHPGSAQNIVAEKFRELIEERYEGSLSVQIYDSGSLGSEGEILLQIQKNTVQMGVIAAGAFDVLDTVVRVVGYPFLFHNSEEADRILDGPLGAEILRSLENFGCKGICYSENGFRNLSNSKRPVKTPDDLRGLKIRVLESSLHKFIWQEMGADSAPLPWPINAALERGSIDGQENPLWVMDVYKFYEIQKYMTLTRHVYSPHINVASLIWWNCLDPQIQKLIETSMLDAAIFQRAENRSKVAGILEMLRSKDVQIEDKPDIKAFRDKVAGINNANLYADPRIQNLLLRVIDSVR